jgi:hypothetical protein
MGHTATVVNQGLLDATYNYSAYDIIVLGYNSVPADLNPIITLNENGQLGIVVMRADSQVDELDLGASLDEKGKSINERFLKGQFRLVETLDVSAV